MTADVQREPLVDLLVAHQRQGNGGGCLCGGVRLGESYPEHVADLLLPLIADAEKRAAATALRALRARLAACEDAPTDAALEGLDFTLRVLAHQAAALDPT